MIALFAVLIGFVATNPSSGVLLLRCQAQEVNRHVILAFKARVLDSRVHQAQIAVGAYSGGSLFMESFFEFRVMPGVNQSWVSPEPSFVDTKGEPSQLWCGMKETFDSKGAVLWLHPRSDRPMQSNDTTWNDTPWNVWDRNPFWSR